MITFKLKLRRCIHGGSNQFEELWVLHEFYKGVQTVIAYHPYGFHPRAATFDEINMMNNEPIINLAEQQIPAIT